MNAAKLQKCLLKNSAILQSRGSLFAYFCIWPLIFCSSLAKSRTVTPAEAMTSEVTDPANIFTMIFLQLLIHCSLVGTNLERLVSPLATLLLPHPSQGKWRLTAQVTTTSRFRTRKRYELRFPVPYAPDCHFSKLPLLLFLEANISMRPR
jgi:hypothetical protein